MKKFTLVKLLCMLVAAITLATAASAAGFTKTLTYTDDTFKDVKSTSWYAKEVASAYELGFMNGKAEGQFSPDGNVTVAEAITMASRVHAIYNGKEIAKADGKWYEMYVKYALENGIIAEGQFDNFNRNIMRYEMAVMFHDAMPKGYYNAINDVKAIPDVAETEEYHEKLMTLYNAGIVMGSTDFGDFLATNSIKRSETAAIINRVALPENRQKKTLLEYGDREPALFLIDNFEMTRTTHGIKRIASGWTYENTANPDRDLNDTTTNALADNSDEACVAIHRIITTQYDGVIDIEFKVHTSTKAGARIYFTDLAGNIMLELLQKDGKLFVIGDKENKTDAEYGIGSHYGYIKLDLDNKKAFVLMDDAEVGTFDVNVKATELAKMTCATTDEDITLFTVNEVHMWKNYVINDYFRIDDTDSEPYGWNVSGNVKIIETKSDKDYKSVQLLNAASASKTFEPVSDKFVYETAVFTNKQQNLTVSLKSGDTVAVSVNAANGKFTSDGKAVRDYTPTVWQMIRIEGDTEKGTALIKINGKNCITVDLKAKSVDNVEIKATGTGPCWFDDVELYNVYDYADYCPSPVPVNDDEYYVGMSVCSLWREGSHYGWDAISPYDEATPVLGYYDEGIIEVADWEIKFLVEHGVDFQHYCWYIGDSDAAPIKEPRLTDAALHDGYFNAKYSNMMKFSIMWENANGGMVNSLSSFKSYVWDYWCDWYFSDPRYMTIDNKPVLTIYRYSEMVKHFGSPAAVKEAIDFMRTDIKNLGFDDIIILFSDRGDVAGTNKQMKNAGADALVSYTFGENSYLSSYQIDAMTKAYNAGSISLLPSIGVGFNDIGWTEQRTPFATPEEHLAVHQWAKNTYLPMLAEREGKEWLGKFVFLTTWNEYGEGHYIMPTNVCGFGYLDATRATFSSVAGKDDSAHFDVVPTDNQKARLGYLYPAVNTPMRKQQLVSETQDILSNDRTISWDLTKPEEAIYWVAMMNVSGVKYDANEKALVGVTTTNDPAIKTLNSPDVVFSADDAKYLYINMKVDKGISGTAQMHFNRAGDTDWSGDRKFDITVPDNGEYNEFIIDLSSHNLWKGEIVGLRFDMASASGVHFAIKEIALISGRSEGSLTLRVDNTESVISKQSVKKVGNEYFVAGNPSSGFYSIHNLYYEWNRWDGTLMVKANNGTVMNFTVGSDVAYVNGKEKKLASTIDMFDGLVMVPVKFIYDNAGFEYKQDGDIITVTVRDDNIEEIIANRVDNQFEFEVAGDLEGWVTGCASGNVSGGSFGITATPVSSTKTGFDPQISLKGVSIDTLYYKTIEVRFRPNFEGETTDSDLVTLYFETSSSPGLSESKTVKYYYKDIKPDDSGYYTLTFNVGDHEAWTGKATQIRFDPANLEGFYEIDYVRILMDEEAAKIYADKIEEEKKIKEAINAVDNGGPFYIYNADAEGSDPTNLFSSSFYKTTIVEDDLRKDNHAYLMTPGTHQQIWTYFYGPTRFKAGMTYKVTCDLRLVSDHEGNPGQCRIAANFRYAEIVDGSIKEGADHSVNIEGGTLSTDDGWKTVTFEHTVSEKSPSRGGDMLCFFANPSGDKNDFLNYIFMVDNLKVEVVEAEEKAE